MNTKKLTRKHIVNIIVCSIILLGLIVAFICYVHEPDLTRDTDRKPDITFNGKTFDISAKDFVRIVNEDLEKEGLSPISEDYAKDASEISMLNDENKQLDFAYEEYTCPIDKNLTLHLFVFPELDDGIASIQLQSRGTPSLTTKKTQKATPITRSSAIISTRDLTWQISTPMHTTTPITNWMSLSFIAPSTEKTRMMTRMKVQIMTFAFTASSRRIYQRNIRFYSDLNRPPKTTKLPAQPGNPDRNGEFFHSIILCYSSTRMIFAPRFRSFSTKCS